LLLLSGCGEIYDQGPEYHRHVYYRSYDYGPRYYGGYDGYYEHHPHYVDHTQVVVVAPHPAPYAGYRSRAYVAPGYYGHPAPAHVVVVSTKPKKKVYYHD